jgi:GxxExxY protein
LAESDLVNNELTREIIGSAMEVHRTLGCGFLESVYEQALAIEFELRNISFERQETIDVLYKGKQAKEFICDFLVDRKVLVEIKAIAQLTNNEEAQVLNYLKATEIKVGLLINFGEKSLKHRRFVL